MIVIIDYGMGNLASIQNMLKKIGAASVVSSSLDDIGKSEKIILPGVGAFDNAVQNITRLGISEILNDRVINQKVPVLGICLGMQLLMNRSEEGLLPGLGWIQGEVKKFGNELENSALKVPHMGWNVSAPTHNSNLFKNLDNPRFYFVHSFYVECSNSEDVLATTTYGVQFASAVNKGNIYGTQFHPEKSHKYGMQLLKNFAEL